MVAILIGELQMPVWPINEPIYFSLNVGDQQVMEACHNTMIPSTNATIAFLFQKIGIKPCVSTSTSGVQGPFIISYVYFVPCSQTGKYYFIQNHIVICPTLATL